MKNPIKLFIIFCLLNHYASWSQTNAKTSNQKSSPKTNNSSNTKNIGGAGIQNLVTSLKHDTCLDKKFSIVFYLIADSTYPVNTTTIISSNQGFLANIIGTLNAAFKPICVSFQSCSTVVIPNYPYNKWDKRISESQIITNWYTDKTINVYLPMEVINGGPNAPALHPFHPYAYAYPTSTTITIPNKDVIVVQKDKALQVNNSLKYGDVLLHTFGHYFGLPHTFDEINPNLTVSPSNTNIAIISKEYVDRSNCYLHGDGFCDTEADPYPVSGSGPFPFCFYTAGAKDAKGVFYEPPIDNYMSCTACACRFTQEQYNFMARFILTKRLYLH